MMEILANECRYLIPIKSQSFQSGSERCEPRQKHSNFYSKSPAINGHILSKFQTIGLKNCEHRPIL